MLRLRCPQLMQVGATSKTLKGELGLPLLNHSVDGVDGGFHSRVVAAGATTAANQTSGKDSTAEVRLKMSCRRKTVSAEKSKELPLYPMPAFLSDICNAIQNP